MTRLDWSRANVPNPDPARVIDVGEGWARDPIVVKQRKKGKASKRSEKRSGVATGQVAPLIIPKENVELVKSIMRDLGRSLPSKRNRLNNRLRKLIEEGVISNDGQPIKSQPIFQEWLAVVEGRKKSYP